MRDIFFDLSVRSVRLNFLRSVLASVGIVIGVVAISAMGMLGANMQLQVKSQLSSNANTIVISPDTVRIGPPGTFVFSQSSSQSGITKSQLTQIRTAVGSDGMVIPIISNSTNYIINSVPGRGSLYAMEPNDHREIPHHRERDEHRERQRGPRRGNGRHELRREDRHPDQARVVNR